MDGALPLNPALDDRSADFGAATVLPALLHRLATPVGTIVNYLYLLEDDPGLSPDARDTLAPLRRATDAITGTLAEARRLVEAGEMPLDLRAVDPLPLLERAAGAAELAVTAKAPQLVHACPDALETAFAELVDLLALHAGAEPIPVRIESVAESDQVRFTFAVPGAPWTSAACAARPEVFAAVAEGHEEAGAGLAIVATLLRRMNGSMRREVRPQAGARVFLQLPRGQAVPQ